jgi:hypothetical protein
MKELKQYKCLVDLEKLVSEIKQLRARPIIRGKHATLYEDRLDGKYRTVMGIRICDFRFNVDETWILPDRQMGLSFSATWANLKFVLGMQAKRAKQKPVDVFWVLSDADIPAGLEFVEDESNSGHYFLAVTKPEGMSVEELARKLEMVAYRMSVIRDGGKYI